MERLLKRLRRKIGRFALAAFEVKYRIIKKSCDIVIVSDVLFLNDRVCIVLPVYGFFDLGINE